MKNYFFIALTFVIILSCSEDNLTPEIDELNEIAETSLSTPNLTINFQKIENGAIRYRLKFNERLSFDEASQALSSLDEQEIEFGDDKYEILVNPSSKVQLKAGRSPVLIPIDDEPIEVELNRLPSFRIEPSSSGNVNGRYTPNNGDIFTISDSWSFRPKTPFTPNEPCPCPDEVIGFEDYGSPAQIHQARSDLRAPSKQLYGYDYIRLARAGVYRWNGSDWVNLAWDSILDENPPRCGEDDLRSVGQANWFPPSYFDTYTFIKCDD